MQVKRRVRGREVRARGSLGECEPQGFIGILGMGSGQLTCQFLKKSLILEVQNDLF